MAVPPAGLPAAKPPLKNGYFDFATGGSVLRMKFFSKKMG